MGTAPGQIHVRSEQLVHIDVDLLAHIVLLLGRQLARDDEPVTDTHTALTAADEVCS